jgi:predicted ABC-type ATPase
VRDDPRASLDRPLAGGDSLARRLDALPEGHPSARAERPRETDGRLLSDAEWREHVAEVRDGLEDAERAGLSTEKVHTIDEARQIWTHERDLIHDEIIDELYQAAANVPCDGKAIVAGGLGGAGKTTVLRERAGIDLTQYLTINPDQVKEKLAERGLVPSIAGLSPMEASALAHEESSHIAKRLARRAEADHKNVVWDITMSSRESASARITKLRSEGYAVEGIFVDISTETSVRRAEARHREGHVDYLCGTGLGGRYLPPEVIRSQADPEWGSKNRKTFEEVKRQCDSWRLYDNSVDHRPAVLIEASQDGRENER